MDCGVAFKNELEIMLTITSHLNLNGVRDSLGRR